jgi:16S rRNA processing protein RimM
MGGAPRAGAGRAEGWLRAGRVGRPHGLDGSFHVSEARMRLLQPGRTLLVGGVTARILERKGSAARPIIRLDRARDRADAESLRGQPLLASRQDAPPLQEDEWWAEDLEGCTVRAGRRTVGTVVRLLALPSCEALEVRRSDGPGELLVPLVSDAVHAVDVDRRAIEIDVRFLSEELG